MENRELVNSGKMTARLIGFWFLWGLLFGFIYLIVFSIIRYYVTQSLVILAIIAIVLQGLMTIFLWKLSTSSAFSSKTISRNDISTVMRNLVIFTITIYIINGANNFFEINSKIDKEIASNPKLKMNEILISRIYNKEELNEYNKQKEAVISQAKSQVFTYLIILEVGLIVVNLAILPIERKEIAKYVV